MTIEISLDGRPYCTMGPNHDQIVIGEPQTVCLTYNGDQEGKFFVSDLVKMNNPSVFFLTHPGDAVEIEVPLPWPLVPTVNVPVLLRAIKSMPDGNGK